MRGDKNSLALLSSKRVKAYSRTRADEAFALPSFSDALPVPTTEPPRSSNTAAKTQPERHVEPKPHVEHDSENVKQTMLEHESLFKEQLHELHRLYQKQCMLMESRKGHAFHSCSEPPSSNSSFLYNPDSFKLQEDRSFGDASVAKAFDNGQNFCAFPTQMVDVKPFEVDAERQKQGCGRPMRDLERPVEGRPMFDLERPPDDLPILDLERPAEEYMDVEVGKEKTQAIGLNCTSADALVLSCSHSLKENRDIITGKNRDLISGKNRDAWGRKKLDFCTSHDGGKAYNICEDAFDSKEKMSEEPGRLGRQYSDFKEDCWSPMGPSTKTLDHSRQDTFSCPASASGLFRGLPDLNGELSSAENETSFIQRKPEKNVDECQYIDLEADSRALNGTSKLPHWLVQPPPKTSRMSVLPNFPAQTSELQQKTTFFSPQVHDKSKSLVGMHTPSPGEVMKTPTLQERYHPWSNSKTNSQQREISFKEPLSSPSLQFFSGANTGAGQGSYEVAHTRGLANESIPSFLSYVRDNDKMGLSTASGVLSSHSMDKQDTFVDTRAASMDLLSRISSRETTALSPVLPWYQQKESFSSLMHQASNPEPPFHRPSHGSSVNPWGATTNHQVLPISSINNVERSIYGMHSVGSNFKGPCVVTRPDSLTKDPVFDFLSSNSECGLTRDLSMQGNAATAWKQVERPFYIGQIAGKTTSSNNDHNLIPSRNVFDLNVSSELSFMEENFDANHFTESRFHGNQKQDCKQECETISSSNWDIVRGNKAPHLNEQREGLDLQAPGFADRLTNKIAASEVSTKDTTQSPIENTFFTRAGTCADNCSGEDETGGFVEVKSSDASGLTSCESRDVAHLGLTKARDDSNTSSGEACQSRESRIPCHKEDVALSSNVQSKRSSGLPLAKGNGLFESQQWGSFLFSTMQNAPGFDTKGDCSMLICAEFGDESEAANSVARKHSMETNEVAELLLSLGFDLPPVVEEGYTINDQEKSLDWLANIIPQEENCEAQVLNVDMDAVPMHEGGSTQLASMGVAEKIMDPFELAVLALKPISPDVECLTTQVMERGSLVENCSSLPNLRRRNSRRGRAGKDFQREMLRSMSSLSRHEITEDLQIIEGLIKSTTEAMNGCSLLPEDKSLSSPDSGSQKKARGTKACRGGNPSGTLNVCSWGESTRRKRMGRQRSQWSCLPPGVQSSPLVNNTDDGLL